MALIRPSLTLIFDLDERSAGEETILELKRSYAHIGVPVIHTHAAHSAEGTPRNVARLVVKMGFSPYLHSADEGADERWHDIVDPWLRNVLHNVGNNMKVFNDRQRKIGLPEVLFERADIELDNGSFIIGLHPEPTGFIDRDLHEQISLARTLLNDGTLAHAVRVDMPSDESYAAQYAPAWEAWIEEHPQAAEPAVGSETAAATEPEAEKTPEQLLEEDIAAKSYENTAVAPTDSNTLPPIPYEEEDEPEPFDFAIDYSQWQVFYADGTEQPFDAAASSTSDADVA